MLIWELLTGHCGCPSDWINISNKELHYGANFWARKTTCVHARYAGQIFGPGKPPAFTQDTRIHKQFILGDQKWTVIRATTFPQFIEQFCSLIKMRLRITAKFTSLMKESGWVPKALLNFQQIVGVEEYFLLCCPNRRISILLSFIGFFCEVIQETGSKCGLKIRPIVQFITVPAQFLASKYHLLTEIEVITGKSQTKANTSRPRSEILL